MNTPAPRVPQPSVAPKRAAQGGGKERKQLYVLAGLAVLLVGVLAVQFGGGSGEGVTTGDDDGDVVALADTSTVANTASMGGAAVQDNTVLTDASGSPSSLQKNVFSSIWNKAAASEPSDSEEVEETPPPSVTLSGTLTSAKRPVAFIDGQKYFLGDMVGSGWVLHAVAARQITLRSPTGRTQVVEMPTVSLN